jgi:hypothetical protein
MAGIVALRGVDGPNATGACPCATSSGYGDAVPAPPGYDPVINVSDSAPMSTTTLLIWAAAIGTVGYIFWATLQPKSRRLVT